MTDPQPDRLAEIRQRHPDQQIEIDWWRDQLGGDDPLASIKAHRELVYSDNVDLLHHVQIRLIGLDWLVAEVEGGRREVERLRQVNKAGSQQVEELLGNLGTWEQLVQDRDAEVERLRETEERLHEAQITIGKLSHAMSEHEVERLRGLLGELLQAYEEQAAPLHDEREPERYRRWAEELVGRMAAEIRPTSGEER